MQFADAGPLTVQRLPAFHSVPMDYCSAVLPTLTPPLFFRLSVECEKLKQEEPQSKPFCIYLTYASRKEPIESIWTDKSDLLMLVQT